MEYKGCVDPDWVDRYSSHHTKITATLQFAAQHWVYATGQNRHKCNVAYSQYLCFFLYYWHDRMRSLRRGEWISKRKKTKQNTKKTETKQKKKQEKIFGCALTLNSSVVWKLTTEGERPFHCGIVCLKNEFFRASLYVWYLQYWALCDALVDFKLWARRTNPYGLKRWPLKLIKHLANTTCISPSPAGPAGCCPLIFLYLVILKFRVRAPNGCSIL